MSSRLDRPPQWIAAAVAGAGVVVVEEIVQIVARVVDQRFFVVGDIVVLPETLGMCSRFAVNFVPGAIFLSGTHESLQCNRCSESWS